MAIQSLTERIADVCRNKVTPHAAGVAPKKRGRPKKSESDASLFSAPQAVPDQALSENAA